MRFYLRFLLVGILSFILILSYSQKTLTFSNPDLHYKTGIELFEKQQYGGAQKHFDMAINQYGSMNYDNKTNAEFYSALCAIELYNEDAEYLITKFIDKHPESTKARLAQFEMGKFRYRQQKYNDAINWFEKVNKSRLTENEKAEYYFKLGYSYFMEDEKEKASESFFEIKDIDTKYTSPAVYYYSHISYTNENYETAVAGFKRLSDDETFKTVVPYYITQILFFQRKYDEVINYAPGYLESASTKRTPEIARIIGESYLVKNEFEKALHYLEIFDEKAKNKTREDKYQLGYTYYRLGNYKEAIELFEISTGKKDSLSQNSYYFLADCYLELGIKERASLAFSAASKMNFNDAIAEDALYNYAKLTFELKLTPFNNAIEAFNEYIQLYPDSKNIDEAYNYLTMAFMNTRNYKDALEALDNIQEKDVKIKEAYQRIAFYRGLELYNNLKYNEAIQAFYKSQTYFWYNRLIRAQSTYWSAESYYRTDDFNSAIKYYNEFLLTPGAISIPEYYSAHYNLGYCYFKKESYDSSLTWFRKYANINPPDSENVLADVYNRIGDCYFIKRDFWIAIENYNKAISINSIDVDYAMFQKGFLFGLVDRQNKKINSIEELVNKYPNSTYFDDGLYELGRSYMSIHDYENANKYYSKLVNDYPNSKYLMQSLLQLGLINYNQNNNQDAIVYYKRIIEEFDNTPQAKNALTGLKNIYIEENDVDSYFKYAESLGKGSIITSAEQDSLMYLAAENKYMQGDCESSLKNFHEYIDKFPYGNFIVSTYFYMAECYLNTKDYIQALNSYEYVINKPNNEFSEQALLNSAKIYFNQKKYHKSYDYFKKAEVLINVKNKLIEAKVGLMRSAKELNDNVKIIESCDKVIHTEQVPEEILREAHYNKAKTFFRKSDFQNALIEFRILSEDLTSTEGAEAKYMIANIKFLSNDFENSKLEIMDYISKGTPHQYWLAKSFMLLSAIYLNLNDNFQAKATLQSLIDNYSIPAYGTA
ncbi:tetratricopeptide repeat protein [Bacteroidota bacterium]